MPRLERKQQFLVTLAVLPIATRLILHQLPSTYLPQWVEQHELLTSLIAGVILTYIDQWLIYQWFRSPLNAFPTVSGGLDVLQLTFGTPRGKIALRWMEQFPTADIIHVRTRIGLSIIVPVSPEGFRDILGSAQYSIQKPAGVKHNLSALLGYGLILSEGEQHKRQRKALTPAFSINNIRGLYPLMWTKAEEFSACVKQEEMKAGFVEIGAWASKLTLDIIGHAALSEDFKTMSTGGNELTESFAWILHFSLTKFVYFVAAFVVPKWILMRVPFSFVRRYEEHCAVIRDRCGDILARKKGALQKGEQRETDMLRDIITSGSFTDAEIVDQMLTFLAAGHETTAGSITWCCYLMAQHPDVQLKLYNELQAELPSDSSQVTHNTLETMPYLNGVCEEVLRLYPAVPITVREVTEETVICGVRVPQTTLISLVPYAVNRNPRFWGPDAAGYQPERWIDTAADGTQRANKHGGTESNLCGMTFLHGNRSCIGRDFAKAELRCAIASLFSRYEVFMWDPEEKIRVVGTVTTKPDVGMKVKLKPRH